MYLDFLYPAFLLLALNLPSTVLAAKPKNAILLSEVQSLTLRADKSTTHRRVSAIPQLKCISPKSICNLHKVDVMRCINQGAGYDTEDIQWACTASLPPELKLGSTEVICEGYKSPDDPYILKGSCGVEYRLVLTDQGEKKLPNLGGSNSYETDWSAWIFGVIFVAVLVWILWSACTAADGNRPAAQRRPRNNNNFWGGGGGWGPGGGGGGGGGGYDPPPPYPGSSKPMGSQGGWQPGFWSGLASGAAGGYWAGRRNDNNSRRNYDTFGGGGGGYGSNWGAGPSSSRSNSGSSSSTSTSRYESTGFGSTSRR